MSALARLSMVTVVGMIFAGASAQAQAPGLAVDQKSCEAFVQNFYDWYWNPIAAQAELPGFDPKSKHSLDDVLTRKPRVLTPELSRLLKGDEDTTRFSGGAATLAFDPFLNGPNPHGQFRVNRVTVSGDRCWATVDAGHLQVELKRSKDGWLIANFIYSFYYQNGVKRDIPDDDLLHLLRG
ncbi:MAG TPA: hypothetical protein VG225_12110 [Terracidiphilus sp.]|nr:hypothetical protein [Terracidiphilus sp.]